jgi:glycosyltransferase involved in cell wall biosynthesis
MRIIMLCPIVSTSSFVTVYPYAKVLSREHDVTVIGPLFGRKKPYVQDDSINYEFIEPSILKPVQFGMLSLFPKNLFRLLKSDYDIVHAFQLLPWTAPAASLSKKLTGKRYILSIDEYLVGSQVNPLKKLFYKMSEIAVRNADLVTVCSRLEQNIYGGIVTYQTPNEELFMKRKYTGEGVRKKYGLEGKIVILYAGTFHKHKGLDILINAVKKLKDPRVKLLLVGGTLLNREVEEYKKIAGEETIFVGEVPQTEIPEFVAACDIYAIPTRGTLQGKMGTPSKVFEGMLMGKAVISTSLADIPLILEHGKAGVLVKPDSVDSLANGLSKLVADGRFRQRIGRRARKLYFDKYSFEKKAEQILEMYDEVGLK